MCAIIDANQAGEFRDLRGKDHLVNFVKWLMRGGKVVIGGKLSEELALHGNFVGLLAEWRRAGLVRQVAQIEIDHFEGLIPKTMRSDDPHVIAICNATSADLVLTADDNLIRDLKTPAICPHRPRIYKRSASAIPFTRAHAEMLRSSDCPI